MKLKLTEDAHIYGAGIGFAGEEIFLSIHFEASCSPAVAKDLGCFRQVYDDNNPPSPLELFRELQLNLALPNAEVRCFNGDQHKGHCLKGKARNFELFLAGEDLVKLRFKITVDGQPAMFSYLQQQKKKTLSRVLIEAASQTTLFPAEPPAAPPFLTIPPTPPEPDPEAA
jgi:hypothetical protein